MARLPISVDDCVHAGSLAGRRAEERMIHHVNGAFGDGLSVGGKYPGFLATICYDNLNAPRERFKQVMRPVPHI